MNSAKTKASHLTLLAASMIAASAAYGLTPIKPVVDHCKKATCGIKWTVVPSEVDQIGSLEIRRSRTSNFGESVVIAEVGVSTSRLTDWGASPYQDYWYWVIPCDTIGNHDGDAIIAAYDGDRYACKNHLYWATSDVYLAAGASILHIDNVLPLYFKVTEGTEAGFMRHVLPDRIVVTRMTDLSGKAANDIADIVSNNHYSYTSGGDSYLKANGSFGYLMPFKPGIVYIRAYYKSATTATPLRIEIRKPTFDVYVPEGNIDIVDNNYRRLYMKRNGKFVCPDYDWLHGSSVEIHLIKSYAPSSDLVDGLYENAFGFLNMSRSGEMNQYDLYYNGLLAKSCKITPVWDSKRWPKLCYWKSDGTPATPPFKTKNIYYFGIKYGDKLFPHSFSIYSGSRPLTYAWYLWNGLCGWTIYEAAGPSGFRADAESSTKYGELGSFSCTYAGNATFSLQLFDTTVYEGISFED